MAKKVFHDFRVETCEDALIEAEDFYCSELKSAATVKKAIARRLKVKGVTAGDIELVKNEEQSEEADDMGNRIDVYDVLVKGECRVSVWVEDYVNEDNGVNIGK